jgi:hypothetical protein
MVNFELVNIAMDIVLIFLAFWMVWAGNRLGGVVGQSMGLVTVGAVVLGFAHLSETILFEVVKIDAAMGEFIHRIIILTAFVFLTLGLSAAGKMLSAKS